VLASLRARGYSPKLFGALTDADPRWPVVAREVARVVAAGACAAGGILFCWTGTGVSIVANKVPGARAALCTDAETARGARRWNDANLLCMGLRLTSPNMAEEILDAWFETRVDELEGANIALVESVDRDLASGR